MATISVCRCCAIMLGLCFKAPPLSRFVFDLFTMSLGRRFPSPPPRRLRFSVCFSVLVYNLTVPWFSLPSCPLSSLFGQLLVPTYNPEGVSGPVKQGWDEQRNLVLHEVYTYAFRRP